MGTARLLRASTVPVERLCPGETFVCIAGGPSLTPDDVNVVQGKARVVAVNDAYRLAPWADVLYAYHPQWWAHHREALQDFHGLKFTLYKGDTSTPSFRPGAADAFGARMLLAGQEDGLSLNPTTLNHGHNSGYTAINLAVLLGARRILLLGYDLQLGAHGKEHWFGSHPKGVRSGLELRKYARRFPSLVEPLKALGIEIGNCSRQTSLECFPRMTIEDALAQVPV